ncbi:uncharacterized protein ACIBXB_009113 [Morphnus guianensis]
MCGTAPARSTCPCHACARSRLHTQQAPRGPPSPHTGHVPVATGGTRPPGTSSAEVTDLPAAGARGWRCWVGCAAGRCAVSGAQPRRPGAKFLHPHRKPSARSALALHRGQARPEGCRREKRLEERNQVSLEPPASPWQATAGSFEEAGRGSGPGDVPSGAHGTRQPSPRLAAARSLEEPSRPRGPSHGVSPKWGHLPPWGPGEPEDEEVALRGAIRRGGWLGHGCPGSLVAVTKGSRRVRLARRLCHLCVMLPSLGTGPSSGTAPSPGSCSSSSSSSSS